MLEKERKQNADGFLVDLSNPHWQEMGVGCEEKRPGGACSQDWQAGDKRIFPNAQSGM